MKSLLIKTSGECVDIVRERDDHHSISTLVAGGGAFDAVGFSLGTIYVDDMGLLNGSEMNLIASALTQRPIAGDVLVCGETDDEGYDTDVHEKLMCDDFVEWCDSLLANTGMIALLEHTADVARNTPPIVRSLTDDELFARLSG